MNYAQSLNSWSDWPVCLDMIQVQQIKMKTYFFEELAYYETELLSTQLFNLSMITGFCKHESAKENSG